MARFTRIEVAQLMARTGLVPVFYHADPETAKNVARACYEGGVRVVEFTNRGDFAHEVFAALRRYVTQALPEMALGVGSVLDAGATSLYLQLGADFIVSPVIEPEMAKVCNRRKVLWSPGCGSVTEITQAHELGAEIVKVFPGAQVGGPGFVKAVKGPLPWTSIMPTGGVSPTEDNLRPWFEAGVTCVGMGSNLVTKDVLQGGDWAALTQKTREVMEIVDRVRGR